MAEHAHTTPATLARRRHAPAAHGTLAGLYALFTPKPVDVALLAACAEFRRLDDLLADTPADDEGALDAAWKARQAAADSLMNMRATTDAGRRSKAAVGLTILLETAAWQRDSEVCFAIAAFQAEAFG